MNRRGIISLSLGGLFCAMFFVSSNILPPVYIVPGVPFTLQIMVVSLIAAVLGLKGGMLTLSVIYLMTISGIPMMSGFSAGPGVFMKPTAGFIIGWIFLVAVLGAYIQFISPALKSRPKYGKILSGAGFMISGTVGVLLVYVCGAAFLAIYNGTPSAFLPTFASTALTFLVFDMIKIFAAFVISETVFAAALQHINKKQTIKE